MLKYSIVQQRNALDENKEEMYYPRLTESTKYELDEVAEMISERSSLTRADIIATLVSLEDIIPKLLRNGGRVELGNLGTFSLHANTETSADRLEVSWRSFKKLTTRFRPGKALNVLLDSVHFGRVDKI